ncbi:DUF389 domain-containing protein [Microbacterium thalassium]|uniref:Putative hydrophobic protein (TIGR00271 family) n=1 Tax=Microbacterium thalassium TaxID=362649 RepID=A0A7X0FLU0_9MICO|nr:DUF389 domain-containing protein [Microbacterium thalassium]MBB6389841.1 putative hydrophobic protein (TIGR00271 family) [Microbacterium thalassium]GLK24528.1 hypothetical protein GCM10017607_18460 [Microbacterium thalassium]
MELEDKAELIDPDTNARFRDQIQSTVSALSNTVALRGLVAMGAGTVVLLLPDATTNLVTLILIVLLGFSGLQDLFYAVSGLRWFGRRINRWLATPRGIAAIALAAAMALLAYAGVGELTLALLVGLVGIYIGIRGVVSITAALLKRSQRDPLPGLAGGSLAVIVGVLAYMVPTSIVSTVIIAGAVGALLVGLILVSWSLRRDARGSGIDPATASIAEVLWDWIDGSDVGRKERAEQATGLYFEEPQRLTKLGTWWVMLILSVAIATFAVLQDSTAVVIGAMLVAPLMTPILGLAGALVNGWGRRAIESAALVAGGAVVSITLAYGLAAWAPIAISFSSNSQITSRVSPNTIDMLIALAAGAAGAFATVNARVASGIAGVAIAVALVPPLAVVGVTLNGGRVEDAGGATLLFLTNFVAIVLSAALVFIVTGFARPYALRNRPRQLLQTVTPFVALAGIIMLPLMLTSESVLQTQNRERDAQGTVEEWLGEDTEFVVTDVTVASSEVQVVITGPGDPPDTSELLDALQDDFVEPVGLELTVVPVDVTVIPAPPG